MAIPSIRLCQCAVCQKEGNHPDKELHQMINLILGQLNEQQRRWFVALEAYRRGHGGVRLMSQITGMDEKTIHRGLKELEDGLAGRPKDRIRLAGGGRPVVSRGVL